MQIKKTNSWPLTAKDAIAAFDRYEAVPVIATPKFRVNAELTLSEEQCVHLMMFSIMRRHISRRGPHRMTERFDPKSSWCKKNKRLLANNPLQIGPEELLWAEVTAWRFLKYGYSSQLQQWPSHQIIYIAKYFPRAL